MIRRVYGNHVGCNVMGIALDAGGGAAGEVKLTPSRAGVYRGRAYSAEPVRVKVEQDGGWSAVLVPSSVVGPYTVKVAGQSFTIEVPDAGKAKFEDLINRSE